MTPGLEVVVGQPQRQAAPDVRLAAETPGADPGVVGAGIGMFLLVDDDVLRVVGAAPALNVGMDLGVFGIGGVGRLPNRVLVQRECMPVRRHVASSRVLVRPLGGLELFARIDFPARLEQEHFHALRGHHVRRHAAGSARTDHDSVVGASQVDFGLGISLEESDEVHEESAL